MTLPRRIAFNEEKSANLQDSARKLGSISTVSRTAAGNRAYKETDGGRKMADGGWRKIIDKWINK